MALYRESFVFRLETDDPAMFWSGHGDILLPADSVLAVPSIALGGGSLINFPDIDGLINGTAQRMDITLSGLSPETAALAAEESLQVPGAAAYIGRLTFDENWQLSGPVVWEWTGEARKLSVTGEAGEGDRTRSITLTLASGDTTRSRAAAAFFTDADQRRNYPTDAFFSHVAGITAGTSRRWGPN